MKFKFSYAKLQEYYGQQEEIARRDYNESFGLLENEKNIYSKMYADLDTAEETAELEKSKPQGLSTETLRQIDYYIDGQKLKIKRQREVVINHTQIVEQKQEILIAAAKEHKIYEKLREKKLAEFKKIEKKHEAKVNDELVVTRFRRGENS